MAVELAEEIADVEDPVLRSLKWDAFSAVRSLLSGVARGAVREVEVCEGREVLRGEDVEVHELLPLKVRLKGPADLRSGHVGNAAPH
eukprot:3297456-Alexandrium_andersonii.AAC.1